jgi:hypothetical protein
MYLHRIDTEKNKKIRILKDKAIQRMAGELEETEIYVLII